MKKDNLMKLAKTIIVALVLSVGMSYVLAWTGPTQPAPNGNVSTPINVGSDPQYRLGNLTIGSSTVVPGTGFLTVINDILSRNLYAVGNTATNGEIQGRYLYSFSSPWSVPNLGTGLPQVGDVYANRFCLSNFSGTTNCTTGNTWDLGVPGTPGQTLRYDATNTLVANSNLFNDVTTNNVGVGTTIPTQKLHVSGNMRVSSLSYSSTTALKYVCTQPDGTLVLCPTSQSSPAIYGAGSPTNPSPGTYTFHVPATVSNLLSIKVWGAGAGGGAYSIYSSSPYTCSGNGGGAGEYRIRTNIAVTPDTDITVVVGGRGNGGAVGGPGTPGTNGGSSAFSTSGSPSLYMLSKGGFRGSNGAANIFGQPITPTSYGGGQTGNTGGTGGTPTNGQNGTTGGCLGTLTTTYNYGIGGAANNGFGNGGYGGGARYNPTPTIQTINATDGQDGRVEIAW